jgi:hypothetical protein
MMKALTYAAGAVFAAGAAVGYVLGTKSGRGAYEKLKGQSADLWHNPTVQDTVSTVTETVKRQTPQIQDKLGALTKKGSHHAAHDTVTATAVTLGAGPDPRVGAGAGAASGTSATAPPPAPQTVSPPPPTEPGADTAGPH